MLRELHRCRPVGQRNFTNVRSKKFLVVSIVRCERGRLSAARRNSSAVVEVHISLTRMESSISILLDPGDPLSWGMRTEIFCVVSHRLRKEELHLVHPRKDQLNSREPC